MPRHLARGKHSTSFKGVRTNKHFVCATGHRRLCTGRTDVHVYLKSVPCSCGSRYAVIIGVLSATELPLLIHTIDEAAQDARGGGDAQDSGNSDYSGDLCGGNARPHRGWSAFLPLAFSSAGVMLVCGLHLLNFPPHVVLYGFLFFGYVVPVALSCGRAHIGDLPCVCMRPSLYVTYSHA